MLVQIVEKGRREGERGFIEQPGGDFDALGGKALRHVVHHEQGVGKYHDDISSTHGARLELHRDERPARHAKQQDAPVRADAPPKLVSPVTEAVFIVFSFHQ